MATDYDAPRKSDEEMSEDSLEELKTRRNDKNSGKVDEDEVEAAESFELPGADLSHEELTVRVLPRQSNEFTCASCFLVKSQSQFGRDQGRSQVLRRLRLTGITDPSCCAAGPGSCDRCSRTSDAACNGSW